MSSLASILAKSGRFNCLTPEQVANCDPKTLSNRKPLLVYCSQVGYWDRITPDDCKYMLAITTVRNAKEDTSVRIFTTLKYVYDRLASSGAFGVNDPEDPYACVIVNPRIMTMSDHAKHLHFVEGVYPVDPNSPEGKCIVMSVDNLSSIIVKDEVIHAPRPTSAFNPKRILSGRSASLLSKKYETLAKYFPVEYRDYKFDDIARSDININDHPWHWKKYRLASCMTTSVEITLWTILGFIILSMMIHWMDN